ncbi:hypothetical protein FQR65_LT09210 [Abscondita terminalis]|nr:hypothetical protein FQR65_LT09210 [Abscondita terminalis]
MNEDIDSETEVLLQIDNVAIKCLKQDLIYHSDYFKAMFEDFKCLLNSDIQEIMTYPDISSCAYVIKVLECMLDLHQKSGDAYSDDIINFARNLRRSKSRVCKQFACILVNSAAEEQARKKQKTASSAVLYDMFMRKRYYKNIDTPDASLSIIYYDIDKHNFIKFLDVDKEKCANLDGFKMIGYKEFIFLFGGEYLMGKGNWNKNFWVYDVVREGWERKSVLPFVRRHFESCICGNYLYIIGGTGNFRVIQHNMFWYNYKDDKWSGQIELPCVERQLKCCCWNEQLFILSITSKCGYVFDCNKSLWYKLSISTQDESVCHIPDNCTIFSYKNHLYIKGDSLIELKLKDQSLVVASCRQLPQQICCDQMESTVCDDIVHTLYKQNLPEKGSSTLTYEQFHMKTNKQIIIFKDVVEETGLELQGQFYTYKMCTAIFGFQHFSLVEKDDFVNEL